jgi:hypothetical protein
VYRFEIGRASTIFQEIEALNEGMMRGALRHRKSRIVVPAETALRYQCAAGERTGGTTSPADPLHF